MVTQSNRQFVSVTGIIVFAIALSFWPVSICNAYEELIDRQAGIRVSVLPVSLARGRQVRLRVWINISSSELNQNVLKTSTLVDDQGKEYHLISSREFQSSGSQYQGDLLFPAIDDDGKTVKLLLEGVAGTEIRIFEWALE